jgi:O-methyltransferase involved in polyketide biosynthesis
MFSNYPSQTLLGSAINRAQHQLLDAPVIHHDPVVVDLVPEARQLSVPDHYQGGDYRIPSLLRAMFAMRSRFAEDRLAEAVQRGAAQYLIIGAGLDTFPWRQPQFAREIAIFAVDHPQSLAWSTAACMSAV